MQLVSADLTSITFSWVAPADDGGATITDYEVYRETTSGSGIWMSVASTGGATSYTATGLTENTQYLFGVSAVNVAGTGERGTQAFSTTSSNSGGGGGGNSTI